MWSSAPGGQERVGVQEKQDRAVGLSRPHIQLVRALPSRAEYHPRAGRFRDRCGVVGAQRVHDNHFGRHFLGTERAER